MFTVGSWQVEGLTLGKVEEYKIDSRKDAKNAAVMNREFCVLLWLFILFPVGAQLHPVAGRHQAKRC